MQIISIAALAKPTVSPLKEVGAVAPRATAAPPPSSAGERPGAHGEAFARLLRQAQAAARQDAAMPYAQETMPPPATCCTWWCERGT